jgi:predicted nucleic acid-binding Zn ribbon protein
VPTDDEHDRHLDELAPVDSAAAEESRSLDLPRSDESGTEDSTGHDPAGLDLARSVAAGARATPRRPTRSTNSGRARSPQGSTLSGAHPDARDPAPIGSVVERIVTEGGWDTDLKVHGVFGRWSSIVGTEVAAHCTPTRFADGHLEVRTDSTAWATQLRLLAPSVLKRLNEELGHDSVLRIDVVGPEAPNWRRGTRSVRGGRGPRDTYG